MLLSMAIVSYKAIPFTFAQTNAPISALYSNSPNATSAQGLETKKMVNYFDSSLDTSRPLVQLIFLTRKSLELL